MNTKTAEQINGPQVGTAKIWPSAKEQRDAINSEFKEHLLVPIMLGTALVKVQELERDLARVTQERDELKAELAKRDKFKNEAIPRLTEHIEYKQQAEIENLTRD